MSRVQREPHLPTEGFSESSSSWLRRYTHKPL